MKFFKSSVLFCAILSSTAVIASGSLQSVDTTTPDAKCALTSAMVGAAASKKMNFKTQSEKGRIAESLVETVPFPGALTMGYYKVRLWNFVLELNRQFRPLGRGEDPRSNRDVRFVLDRFHPAVLIDMDIRGEAPRSPVVAYSLETLHALAVRAPDALVKLHSKVTGIPEDEIPTETRNVFAALRHANYREQLDLLADRLKNRSALTAQLGKRNLESLVKRKAVAVYSPDDSDQSMLIVPVLREAPSLTLANLKAIIANTPTEPASFSASPTLTRDQATVETPKLHITVPANPVPHGGARLDRSGDFSNLELGPKWTSRPAPATASTSRARALTISTTEQRAPTKPAPSEDLKVDKPAPPPQEKPIMTSDLALGLVAKVSHDLLLQLAFLNTGESMKSITTSDDWKTLEKIPEAFEQLPPTDRHDLLGLLSHEDLEPWHEAHKSLLLPGREAERAVFEKAARALKFAEKIGIQEEVAEKPGAPENNFKSLVIGGSDSAREEIQKAFFGSSEGNAQFASDSAGLIFSADILTDLPTGNSRIQTAGNRLIAIAREIRSGRLNRIPDAIPMGTSKEIVMITPGAQRFYISIEGTTPATKQIVVLGFSNDDKNLRGPVYEKRLAAVRASLVEAKKK